MRNTVLTAMTWHPIAIFQSLYFRQPLQYRVLMFKPRRSVPFALLRQHVAAALLALTMPAAAASGTWYQIEVIVFEQPLRSGIDSEAWPEDPGVPSLDGALELAAASDIGAATPPGVAEFPATSPAVGPTDGSTGAATDNETAQTGADLAPAEPEDSAPVAIADSLGLRGLVLLPTEDLKLSDVAKRLNRTSGYKALLHIGWRQQLTRDHKAEPIHIYSDVDGSGTAPSTIPSFSLPDAASLSTAQASLKPLDGTVAVFLSRYLHVTIDLVYAREQMMETAPPAEVARESVSADGGAGPASAMTTRQLYRLSQTRRLRSKELHYIDHPAFGVLVEAFPLKLQAATGRQ
jgi:hypothetical protein